MKKIFIFLFLILLMSAFSSAILNDDIVAYWKFDGVVGDVLNSVDFRNGTLNDTIRGYPGIINNSFYFEGTSSFANLTNLSGDLHSDSFTISLWTNMTSISASSPRIIGRANGIQLLVNTINGFGYSIMLSNGTQQQFNVGNAFQPINQWTHFIMTFNNDTGNASLYINGALNGTLVFGAGATIEKAGELEVGFMQGTSAHYNGSVDEVGYWNREITSNEVSQLYNSGVGLSYPFFNIITTLQTPSNNTQTASQSVTFNASYISQRDYNLTNTTFYLWNSTGSLINQTTSTITGTTNTSSLLINSLNFDTYEWNYFGCAINGSNTDCAFAEENFTLIVERFQINSELWTNNTFDTDNRTFNINILVDESAELFSSSLIYNGASYLAESQDLGGGIHNITAKIDIPVVNTPQNLSFNWSITLQIGDDFSVQNTENNQQDVSPSSIINVSSGQQGTINFTIIDEETLERSSGTFDSTINFYLGDGTIIKNNSFGIASSDQFLFNSTPSYKRMYLDTTIFVSNVSSNTTTGSRLFDFNKFKIFNDTTEVQLLLPNASRTRNVIIEVKDEGLNPLSNILVQAKRFYPNLNEHKIVESRRTDNFGQFSGRFVENDVIYRFEFYDENNTLLKTEDRISISCRTIICVLPFVIESEEDPFDRFRNNAGFDSTLTFNNNTNIFTYTWNDVTNDFSSARLEVTRFLFNGTTTICNQTSFNNPGTLTCGVGSSTASYTAQAYRTNEAGRQIRIHTLSIKVGDLTKTYGFEGLMWSFFLLLTLISVGAWSPPVGVVLYLVGYILLGVLGIVFIHPGIVVAQIVIGVLFIWAWKGG